MVDGGAIMKKRASRGRNNVDTNPVDVGEYTLYEGTMRYFYFNRKDYGFIFIAARMQLKKLLSFLFSLRILRFAFNRLKNALTFHEITRMICAEPLKATRDN